jgi:hypothetical protein
MHLCVPPIEGTEGGDFLRSLLLIRPKKNCCLKVSKKKWDHQWGAGSSGEPSRGTGMISKPTVEVSAKSRDEPVVTHLQVATPRASLLEASSSDIPLQSASSCSTPAEGEGLRHLASGVCRLHLANIKLSGCDKWKLKKARASQAGTGAPSIRGIWVCREKPKQGPLRGQSLRAVSLRKGSHLQKSPETLEHLGYLRRLWPISREISSRRTILKIS